MSKSQIEHPKVVTRSEWLVARKELLKSAGVKNLDAIDRTGQRSSLLGGTGARLSAGVEKRDREEDRTENEEGENAIDAVK